MKKSVKRESRFCKRVSRRCQEGVKSVSRTCTGRGCQEDIKRVSRGHEDGVKAGVKRQVQVVKRVSRWSQKGVKGVSRRLDQECFKRVSTFKSVVRVLWQEADISTDKRVSC